MTTKAYDRLNKGPIDEIDAAIWSGDIFFNHENLADFRSILKRWEEGLKQAEDILTNMENS